MKKIAAGLIASILLLSACNTKTPDEVTPEKMTTIEVLVNNMVADEALVLVDKEYTNPYGLPFNVKVFKYFLSNFQFVKTDGTIYTVPQDSCYFLVDQTRPESLTLHFNVPEGTYRTVNFMMGVDSLRNTKSIDERQGDLDPTSAALGMYWTWNSGYIHFMFEGTSSGVPVDLVPGQMFQYHIGGFGGYSSATPNNTRNITMDLNDKGVLKANTNSTAKVYIKTDIYTFFNTPNKIDLTTNPLVMVDKAAIVLADNAVNIFSHAKTEND